MQKPKASDLIWAAGLFDGEGCLHARRHETKGCVNIHATISMVFQPAVRRIHRLAGCGVFKKNDYGVGRRVQWKWVAVGQQAAGFVRMLLPFLMVKRKEALIFLRIADEQKRRGNRHMTERSRGEQSRRISALKKAKRYEWQKA